MTSTNHSALRLQYLLGHNAFGATWRDCGDRTAQFLAWAMAHTQQDEEQVVTRLLSGATVKWAVEWDAQIRCGNVADRRTEEAEARQAAIPAPRFTCPRCGEHRDATRSGHCDDCEA